MRYLFPFLFLSSCTSATSYTVHEQKLPVAHPPEIQHLQLNNFEWKVLTASDLKDLLKSVKPGEVVIIGLDVKNFRILDSNLYELKRYIEEQNQVIIFYRQLQNSITNKSE